MAIPLILSQPRVVLQTAQMTCWAAAFNSWARAAGVSNPPDEARMVQLFSGVTGALGADNSATERGIRTINSFGFMSSQASAGSRLTPQVIEGLLQQGHIYLAFRPAPAANGAGHVVVVYGIESATHVRVMDPAAGLATLPISFFQSRSHVVVGVPNGIVRAYAPTAGASPFSGMGNAPVVGGSRPTRTGLPGYDF